MAAVPRPCCENSQPVSAGGTRLSNASLPLHPPQTRPFQHSEDEYGAEVGPDGRHHGGPFTIEVSPKMRVEELRKVIRVRRAGGCIRLRQCKCWLIWLDGLDGGLPCKQCTVQGLHATTFHASHLPQDNGGIIPALQRLSYAGKNMEDAQRTLEQ